MSGGIEIMMSFPKMTFCDPWLEKKYKLFNFLYRLGLKRRCGVLGYSYGTVGTWTYVW